MKFRTEVQVACDGLQIEPLERVLLVGSCFADNMGRHFQEERFPTACNPFGTMYNPASVLHTVQRLCHQWDEEGLVPPRVVFLTLGTNHIYRLKETGEIVDNCQKRPQRLFSEEVLSVSECADYLQQAIDALHSRRPDVQVVFTVSPIRYAKYGYHGSQLSKAALLMAVDSIVAHDSSSTHCALAFSAKDKEVATAPTSPAATYYFPAYELVMDELRDYRFYAPDMLHPSEQAVDYLWERLVGECFSPRARQWLDEWRPVKEALHHRPFNPDSEEYRQFLAKTREREATLLERYGGQ